MPLFPSCLVAVEIYMGPVFWARDTWRQQRCAFFSIETLFLSFLPHWDPNSDTDHKRWWVLKGVKGGGEFGVSRQIWFSPPPNTCYMLSLQYFCSTIFSIVLVLTVIKEFLIISMEVPTVFPPTISPSSSHRGYIFPQWDPSFDNTDKGRTYWDRWKGGGLQ